MEDMYSETGDEEKPHGGAGGEEKNKHKEEGEARRRLDEADRRKIGAELEKYTHPLNEQHPGVYNICNGQVVAAVETAGVMVEPSMLQPKLAISQASSGGSRWSAAFHSSI